MACLSCGSVSLPLPLSACRSQVLMSVDAVFKTVTKEATDPDQLMSEAYEFGLTMDYVQQLSFAAAEQLRKEQVRTRVFDGVTRVSVS